MTVQAALVSMESAWMESIATVVSAHRDTQVQLPPRPRTYFGKMVSLGMLLLQWLLCPLYLWKVRIPFPCLPAPASHSETFANLYHCTLGLLDQVFIITQEETRGVTYNSERSLYFGQHE